MTARETILSLLHECRLLRERGQVDAATVAAMKARALLATQPRHVQREIVAADDERQRHES